MRTAAPNPVCAAPTPRLRTMLGWAVSACLLVCSTAVLIVAIEALAGGVQRTLIGDGLFLLACLSLTAFAAFSFANRRLGLLGVQWSVVACATALFLTSYGQSDAGLTLSFGGHTRYVHATLPLLAMFFGLFLAARLSRPSAPSACNCG